MAHLVLHPKKFTLIARFGYFVPLAGLKPTTAQRSLARLRGDTEPGVIAQPGKNPAAITDADFCVGGTRSFYDRQGLFLMLKANLFVIRQEVGRQLK